MRTKTLLLAAAAIAAGLASSQAQTVYSANIAGYVNTVDVPITGGGKYTLLANPFDDGNGNYVTNLLAILPKQSQVLVWTGTGYNSVSRNSSGWTGTVGAQIPPGTGFFVKNGGGTTAGPLTNLFVGTENVSNTAAIPTGYSLFGNPIAFAGDITSDTNINLTATLLKQSQVLTWNVTSQGYVSASKNSSGWTGTIPLPIHVAEGFFIKATFTTNWTQVLH